MKHIIKSLIKIVGVSIMIILVIIIALWIDIRYIEPNILIEKKLEIGKGNMGEKLKIVHFTDTHLGPSYTLEELKKLVEKTNKQNPDLVVFTGDLMDHPGQYPYKEEIGKVLSGIQSTYGKYAVWGNHDHGGAGVRYYEDIMEAAGFTLLQNESKAVYTEAGHKINVIGIDDALLGKVDIQGAYKGIKEEAYNIFLMHEPDLVERVSANNYDLVLAGHSHGGQIQIPFIGPIYTPGLAEIYTHGLYELEDEKYLYVNSGVGTTKMEIRFWNPPQIAVLNIKLPTVSEDIQ